MRKSKYMIDNLCKLALEHGGFVQELVVPTELTGGTGLTNPTLLIEDGKYILNLRHVQYSLYHSEGQQKYQTAWGPLTYFNPEDDITLRTVNYICELDPDTLSITKYTKTDTSKLDVKPLWEFIGLEDARLVRWNNKLYQSGVRRDTTTNGVGRMELSEIVDNVEVSRARIEPPKETYCEKNWMPVLDLPYHYVKWTNPTEVVKVNLDTNKAETVHMVNQQINVPRDLRGGSQVVRYKDYYVALTHEVDLWKDRRDRKDAQYYHRFIVWDLNWNIKYYSQEFKFMTARIEFSCGLAIQDGQMIIPFGFQDTTAFILKLPVEVFEYMVGMSDGLEVNNINKTDYLLESFIKFPYNDVSTYALADRYYKSKHYASALSFYLRTAEYSELPNTVYTSLIMVAKCLDKIGRRPHATSVAYYNAISYMPNRPEGYLLLSKYHELKKEYHQAYLNACIGLQYTSYCKENKELEYPGEYALLFQKAISAWYIGKEEEATDLFNLLQSKYNLQGNYKTTVENNLSYILGKPTNVLEDFPFVNCISLDESESRRQNLDVKFKEYGINNYKMYVYNRYNGEYNIKGDRVNELNIANIGATTSHILTIKQWLDESNDEYAFFCEDDLSFETLQYWTFKWKDFISKLPEDWEAVQLCLLSEIDRDIKFIQRDWRDWGCQAYIIKRTYAEKLLAIHYNNGDFDFSIPGMEGYMPCIENVLFDGIGKVYNFPLFVEDINFDSTYDAKENRNTNIRGYNHVINWWKTKKFFLPEKFNS